MRGRSRKGQVVELIKEGARLALDRGDAREGKRLRREAQRASEEMGP